MKEPGKDIFFPLILKKAGVILLLATLLLGGFSSHAVAAEEVHPCLQSITSKDILLVADPAGHILLDKNATRPFIPASTLKILTALSALHYLGPRYRFRTDFYLDQKGNLKVKGYGDPLFISEVILNITDDLSEHLTAFKGLVIDRTYFAPGIKIPGRERSPNPYDAPVGALCANFNTVHFHRDRNGNALSSEIQTPLIPFARDKLRLLNAKQGRHVVVHDGHDAARYAGGLLLHFLNTKGVQHTEQIRFGTVTSEDVLAYTYQSIFPLEEVLQKMLAFSSNFMANQILIAVGAQVYGPPGTLKKGIKALQKYANQYLSPHTIHIQEGSGLSRENRLSARDMLTILKQFKPYRHLLSAENGLLCKTGSLRGIRTRAGYITHGPGDPSYFVVSLHREGKAIESSMDCIRKWFGN
ncbi:MAG: D-alanyl-D-alanine carboxypeptidase [Desulfatiglandaceae bacterium]